MHHNISNRLARLEQKVGLNVVPLPLLFFHFTDDENIAPNFVECDGFKWVRDIDEVEKEFKDRVVSDLAEGKSRVTLILLTNDEPLASDGTRLDTPDGP